VPGNPDDGFEDDAMRMAGQYVVRRMVEVRRRWNRVERHEPMTRNSIDSTLVRQWRPVELENSQPEGGDALSRLPSSRSMRIPENTSGINQENPNEAWDYNATMDMEMAKLTVDGVERKVLMQAPKNGFLYVLDRTDGKLISAGKDRPGGLGGRHRPQIRTAHRKSGIHYEEAPVLHVARHLRHA